MNGTLPGGCGYRRGGHGGNPLRDPSIVDPPIVLDPARLLEPGVASVLEPTLGPGAMSGAVDDELPLTPGVELPIPTRPGAAVVGVPSALREPVTEEGDDGRPRLDAGGESGDSSGGVTLGATGLFEPLFRPGGVPVGVPSLWMQPPIGVTGPVGLVTGDVAPRIWPGAPRRPGGPRLPACVEPVTCA